MEIGVTLYESPGSAPGIAQREERKESEQRQTAELARDTISISPEARERLRMKEGGETGDKAGDQAKDQAGEQADDKVSAAGIMAAGGTGEEPQSEAEKIQKQIRDLEKRIAELNVKLAEAQTKAQRESTSSAETAETATAAQGNPEDEAAVMAVAAPTLDGGAGEAEAKAIQSQLLQMNQQLMALYQQMQDALKGEGGD